MSIILSEIKLIRNNCTIINNFSCSIPTGVVACLIGPNGAGKSSLMQAMVGLLPLAHGMVLFNNIPFEKMRSSVAYLAQTSSVDLDFPTTVYEVVLMGRMVHKRWWQGMADDDHAKTVKALEKVDLLSLKNKRLYELSGGQLQRVFIARALVQEPLIYLMDEPFAGVDKTTERMIIAILKEECAAGKTALLVHHDLATIKDYFAWGIFIGKQNVVASSLDMLVLQDLLQVAFEGSDV